MQAKETVWEQWDGPSPRVNGTGAVTPGESNKTTGVNLSYFICTLVDFSPTGEECSTRYPGHCVRCKVRGVYFSGETIHDFGAGHWICRVIWLITLLVAFLGVVGNALSVVVIQRRPIDKPFPLLLRLQPKVDLLCCFTTFFTSTAALAFYENWFGRGLSDMYWIFLSSNTQLILNSMSVLITIWIAIERYLVLVYPFRSLAWFTPLKTRWMAFFAVAFSFTLGIPRFTSLYVGSNIYGPQEGGWDIPSLRFLPYMYLPTRMYPLWDNPLRRILDHLGYWLPIFFRLNFNLLSYKKVKRLCADRQRLNCSQSRELPAVRMFIPLTVLALCFDIYPIFLFGISAIYRIFYREMWMTYVLTTAANSAANFWIYYYRASTFQYEARLMTAEMWTKIKDVICTQVTFKIPGGNSTQA